MYILGSWGLRSGQMPETISRGHYRLIHPARSGSMSYLAFTAAIRTSTRTAADKERGYIRAFRKVLLQYETYGHSLFPQTRERSDGNVNDIDRGDGLEET